MMVTGWQIIIQVNLREHVLWQYTDSYASPELNQDVDANYVGPGVETSWFTS